jgi:fructose-bisphosphate aldolase class I
MVAKTFALLAIVGLYGSAAFRMQKKEDIAEGFVPGPVAAPTGRSHSEPKTRPFANSPTADMEMGAPLSNMKADGDIVEPEAPLSSGPLPEMGDTADPEQPMESQETIRATEWDLKENNKKSKPERTNTKEESRIPLQPAVFLMGGLLLLGGAAAARKQGRTKMAASSHYMEPTIPANTLAELKETATKLCAPGKGFLAADESAGPWTRAGNSEAEKVPDTEENRAAYRSLIFSTPGLSESISGCILHRETLYQKNAEGKEMVDLVVENGMIPGIKLDCSYDKTGMWGTLTGPLGHPEVSGKGLDQLQQDAKDAYKKGARFAKWRNVLQLDPEKGLPSQMAIDESAQTLAKYAAICQMEHLVPIVEPEIVPNGKHGIEYSEQITTKVLAAQMKALSDHHVYLEGCLMKVNMVKNGIDAPKASAEDVATRTVRTLQRTIPPAMAGIFFLSGETPLDEDNEEICTINLNAMKTPELSKRQPWHLSFSFGKALQKNCIVTWCGKKENVEAAQTALKNRAAANSQAVFGKYEAGSCASLGTAGNVEQAEGPY